METYVATSPDRERNRLLVDGSGQTLGRLARSRALIVADPNLRGELKRRGFLTREPRVKEREKAGFKKARKRSQFSQR